MHMVMQSYQNLRNSHSWLAKGNIEDGLKYENAAASVPTKLDLDHNDYNMEPTPSI